MSSYLHIIFSLLFFLEEQPYLEMILKKSLKIKIFVREERKNWDCSHSAELKIAWICLNYGHCLPSILCKHANEIPYFSETQKLFGLITKYILVPKWNNLHLHLFADSCAGDSCD